tara:strand:- start:2951 stop:3118 length:168 start_codon:yes stop_codon:yes gene_type:complete
MYKKRWTNHSTWISRVATISRGFVEPPLIKQLPVFIGLTKRGLEPLNNKPARRKK